MSGNSNSALGIFDSAYFPEISDDRSSLYCSAISEINQEIRRTNASAAAAAASSQGPHMMAGFQGGPDANRHSDPWESFLDADNGPQHEASGDGWTSTSAADSDGDGDRVCVCKIHRRASRSFASHAARSSPAVHRSSMNMSMSMSSNRSKNRHLSTIADYHSNSTSAVDAATSTPAVSSTSEAERAAACPTCGKKRPLDSAGFAWTHRPRQYPFSTSNSLIDGSYSSMLGADGADEPQHAEALLQSTPLLRFLSPASTDINGAGNVTSPHLWSMVLAQVTGGDTNGLNAGLANLSSLTRPKAAKSARDVNGSVGGLSEYRASLVRDRANHRAAAELASLLWVLAHEMSLEDYGTVESQVFSSVFSLVHESDAVRRMAGLAALDALLAAPSADEEKKAIKFANTLSNGLRAADGDFEFLSALSKALGHMAERTANVDFVESEVTRALEWLRTERSDRRYVRYESIILYCVVWIWLRQVE
jgi:hypothetical protein